MSLKAVLYGSVFALAATAAVAVPAMADTFAPPTLVGTNNNTPQFVVTFNADGSISTVDNGGGPYITEDAYLEFINNTATNITSYNLSSTTNIFGFDSDGIDNFGGGTNASDTTGYGGGDAFFTNINAATTAGTVNFLGTGIDGNGGTGYFSLEEALTLSQVVQITGGGVPEPMSLALVGTGLAGLAFARRARRSV